MVGPAYGRFFDHEPPWTIEDIVDLVIAGSSYRFRQKLRRLELSLLRGFDPGEGSRKDGKRCRSAH
jgi:hypothetical protein